MDKKSFELGDYEVFWHNGLGYQVTWVDEYGIDAVRISGTGNAFSQSDVADFKTTEEFAGAVGEGIFMLEFLITRTERSLIGLKEELERLKSLRSGE